MTLPFFSCFQWRHRPFEVLVNQSRCQHFLPFCDLSVTVLVLLTWWSSPSKQVCRICDLQVPKAISRHSTTGVSYYRPYAETKNNGKEREVCMKWIQFRSWFRPRGAKVSSFIIQKFSRCFSLSFNASVDVVRMFLSCSMIMIFRWLLKSWSCLLKCLQAGIAFGFLTSFLWLLSLNVEWCFWFTNVLNVTVIAF